MSFSDTIKSIIGTVAPVLGTALGGPLGALAGGMISKALGKDGKPASPAEVEKAILGQDPAALLALKQAELELQKHMADLGIEEEQLKFSDTANARAREVSVKDSTPRNIAYAVVFLVILFEGVLLFHGQPKDVDGVVLGRIMGTLDSALMLVLSYFFGSSVGSAAKDKTIANLAQ